MRVPCRGAARTIEVNRQRRGSLPSCAIPPNRMTERMQPSELVILWCVAMDEHHARGSQRSGKDPLFHDSISNRSCGAVPSSSNHLQCVDSPSSLATLGEGYRSPPPDSCTFASKLSSSSSLDRSSFDHRRLTTSSRSIPLASLTSVAKTPVSRLRISSLGRRRCRNLS